MIKLKLCPFCGCEAYTRISNPNADPGFYLYSVGCDTRLCPGHYGNGWVYRGEDAAIEAWNTRVELTCEGCEYENMLNEHGLFSYSCDSCKRARLHDNYKAKAVN